MILTTQHVSFSYGPPGSPERVREGGFGLRDVSLSVAKGSLTGILGPNGCGKTTLLKLLAGITRPHQGDVQLDGRSLRTFGRRDLARRIAVVPQETHPAFDYTAIEMALMGRHPHLGAFQLEGAADLDIAMRALESTGTSHLAARPYMTLSGGEKQRVIIASALAQQPDVLLLDEPTASLDLAYQLEIASLLGGLNRERGVTMAIATHDLNLAASLCDRLVLLRGGELLAEGPTGEVLTREAIAQLYGVDADVSFHERSGHLTVVPVGPSTPLGTRRTS